MKHELRKCARDPLFKYTSVACCLLTLAGFVVHFTLYAPTRAANEQLGRQLTELQSEYTYRQNLSSELKRVEGVQDRLKELNLMLERRFSSVAFSSEMERFVNESGVEVVAQSYSPARERGQFNVVDINLRVSSDYKSIRKFIGLISNSQFFVAIEKAKLESRDARVLSDLDLQVRYLGEANDG